MLETGKIPEEVASMPTLELLDCSNNKLSGKNTWFGRSTWFPVKNGPSCCK